jgi:AcrR family transcriptional regulator
MKPEISYIDFQRGLKPRMAGLFLEIFRENRESIKVKKEQVAVKNLEKIFQAMLKLSQQKGFHAMSLRDLSRASGLSMGALYSYFASKDDLRGHVFRYGARFARDVLQVEAEAYNAPADKLAAAIRAHLYLSEAQRPWFYFSYMEAKNLPKKERLKAMENERLTEKIFSEILKEGVDRKTFFIKDVALTAALIKAMLQDWYLKRWKYRESGAGVEEYADFVINFVLGSISSNQRSGKHE